MKFSLSEYTFVKSKKKLTVYECNQIYDYEQAHV